MEEDFCPGQPGRLRRSIMYYSCRKWETEVKCELKVGYDGDV